MTDYLLPFEVASVLLLVALLGAAMLVRRRTDPVISIEHYLIVVGGSVLPWPLWTAHEEERHQRVDVHRAHLQLGEYQSRRLLALLRWRCFEARSSLFSSSSSPPARPRSRSPSSCRCIGLLKSVESRRGFGAERIAVESPRHHLQPPVLRAGGRAGFHADGRARVRPRRPRTAPGRSAVSSSSSPRSSVSSWRSSTLSSRVDAPSDGSLRQHGGLRRIREPPSGVVHRHLDLRAVVHAPFEGARDRRPRRAPRALAHGDGRAHLDGELDQRADDLSRARDRLDRFLRHGRLSEERSAVERGLAQVHPLRSGVDGDDALRFVAPLRPDREPRSRGYSQRSPEPGDARRAPDPPSSSSS